MAGDSRVSSTSFLYATPRMRIFAPRIDLPWSFKPQGRLLHHETGDRRIDLAGQLDKACRKTVFPGFPGQIKGIDSYAVATQAGTGIERRETEGFRLGCIDDFPDSMSILSQSSFSSLTSAMLTDR